MEKVKMNDLLSELEVAGWDVLDVKTTAEKDKLAQRIIRIKSDIRKLVGE